jgi:crotonobetainyl-CoA:carnitine CoA-transferase CaiB-like acyl-CoA transferase
METNKVFSGLKVLDFGTTVVGPSATRVLADYGAVVIKVETSTHVDGLRTSPPYKDNIPGVNRSGYFNNYNAGKYSLSLNLKLPAAIEFAKRLVQWADIVLESFRPGIMEKWGLGYPELCKVNPGIIMVSSAMLGHTGPHCQYRGYGQHGAAIAGWGALIGWPEGEPLIPFGAYSDYISARYVAIAMLAALEFRRRTGKGMHIDNSQVECSLDFQAPLILDYAAHKRLARPSGNRNPHSAPHGVFRCLGDDRWCAISVSDEREWQAFCKALGTPSWVKEPRWSTLQGRKENEDLLEEKVGEWTGQRSAEEVVTSLQKEGVPAALVTNWEDMTADPQINHRQHFVPLRHSEIGTHVYENFAFRLSETPGGPQAAAPCLGEHNEFICTKILGLTDEEFVELLTNGIFE